MPLACGPRLIVTVGVLQEQRDRVTAAEENAPVPELEAGRVVQVAGEDRARRPRARRRPCPRV